MSSSLEYLHLQSISQAEGVQLLSLRVPCAENFLLLVRLSLYVPWDLLWLAVHMQHLQCYI